VRAEGGGVQISLSGGSAVSALFPDLAVAAGDTVTAEFNAAGPAERVLRTVLIRHCDSEHGDATASESFVLAEAPRAYAVRLRFEQAYSCVRVSFLSQDGAPLSATISDLTLTKS
jgi:hypothetical protein